MIRATVLGVAALLCLLPSVCTAQFEAGAVEETQALPESWGNVTGTGARTVGGEAVVDLADFVAEYLAQTGTAPDYAQAQSSSGELTTLSAAEVFALLARTAHLWRFTGALPETVPIAPDEVSPPPLDPEDVVVPPGDEAIGREIPTEQFLAVCPAVVRFVDRVQVIPTSVWVDGQRLSAAEYLAGLAVCISYAYWEGQLYDSIVLPAYAPPYSWLGETEPAEYAGTTWEEEPAWDRGGAGESEEPYWEWEGEEPSGVAAPPPSLPLHGTAEAVAPQAEPRLMVYPEPGSTVAGVVDVVASYVGPPARFVVLTIDSQSEIIMNSPPYGYRWDTRDLEPGVHSVRVQVLGDGDVVLADQMSAFFVVPPESEAPEQGVRDDL